MRVLGLGWTVARPALLFALDVLECLARMLVPALCAVVALAVAVAVGQVLVASKQPAAAGFTVGALAVCIVAGLLAWAEHRHRWWS